MRKNFIKQCPFFLTIAFILIPITIGIYDTYPYFHSRNHTLPQTERLVIDPNASPEMISSPTIAQASKIEDIQELPSLCHNIIWGPIKKSMNTGFPSDTNSPNKLEGFEYDSYPEPNNSIQTCAGYIDNQLSTDGWHQTSVSNGMNSESTDYELDGHYVTIWVGIDVKTRGTSIISIEYR